MKNYAKLHTIALINETSVSVEIEVVLLRGLPSLEVIGLPDTTIRESKNRVRAAIIASGFHWPQGRMIASYAPVGLHKQGSSFDLALALGILAASDQIEINQEWQTGLVFGELSLQGELKRAESLLARIIGAKLPHFTKMAVPLGSDIETILLGKVGSAIYPIKSLHEAVQLVSGLRVSDPIAVHSAISHPQSDLSDDVAPLASQLEAWRSALIAVSGWHHLFILGSPGSGKTTLLSQMVKWLPELSASEQLRQAHWSSLCQHKLDDATIFRREVCRLNGLQTKNLVSLCLKRNRLAPFAQYWQGSIIVDEADTCDQATVDAIQSTLGLIDTNCISQNEPWHYTTPLILLASNPCHCGFSFETKPACTCKTRNQLTHLNKWRGGFWDRIDLISPMRRVDYAELSECAELASADVQLMRDKVKRCWQVQHDRCSYSGQEPKLNGIVQTKDLAGLFNISPKLLNQISPLVEKLHYSTRSYLKMIRIARTIADLAESCNVEMNHVLEAIKVQGKELRQ